MDLFLTRIQLGQDGIFSELTDNVGLHVAFCLEHAYPTADGGWFAKIPAGVYKCLRGQHRLAGMTAPFETFEISNIPGHSNILFHAGNFNRDSEGCILLGESISGSMILNSKKVFGSFMNMQAGVDSFLLTVAFDTALTQQNQAA